MKQLLEQMNKQNLTSLGIKHDVFTYESNLIKDNMVEKIILPSYFSRGGLKIDSKEDHKKK